MTPRIQRALWALFLSATLVAGAAVAASPTVQVGEVNAHKAGSRHLEKRFRLSVFDSVEKLDTSRVKGGPFVVSASLVRLDTKARNHGLEATAVIEATLRYKDSGNLIGMTRGRATAAGSANNMRAIQSSAMRAAVESALEGVPRALARL